MLAPLEFNSWRGYFRFSFAREFAHHDGHEYRILNYPRNILERVGNFMTRPFLMPTDYLLREIKNPLVITALTVAALAVASFIFYPAQFLSVVYTIIPIAKSLQLWMVKAAAYTAINILIAGVGIRTIGRLCNSKLMKVQREGNLAPITLGSQVFV